MTRPAILLLVCLTLCAQVRAGGEEKKKKEAADRQAKAAVEVFRRQFRGAGDEARLEAVASLRKHDHPLVVAEIGRTALVDPLPEVRCVAARVLGFMKVAKGEAGKLLTDHLVKNEKQPETQIAIIRAIRRLGYRDALKSLQAAAKHFLEEEYRFVTDEVLITLASLKDPRALPFLLTLFEYEGVFLRGRSGPLVRASSRAEAKRIYKKKYGHLAEPVGEPETVVRWWQQEMQNAITAITGETFKEAPAFRTWLTKNYRKLGLKRADIPKKPKRREKITGQDEPKVEPDKAK